MLSGERQTERVRTSDSWTRCANNPGVSPGHVPVSESHLKSGASKCIVCGNSWCKHAHCESLLYFVLFCQSSFFFHRIPQYYSELTQETCLQGLFAAKKKCDTVLLVGVNLSSWANRTSQPQIHSGVSFWVVPVRSRSVILSNEFNIVFMYI